MFCGGRGFLGKMFQRNNFIKNQGPRIFLFVFAAAFPLFIGFGLLFNSGCWWGYAFLVALFYLIGCFLLPLAGKSPSTNRHAYSTIKVLGDLTSNVSLFIVVMTITSNAKIFRDVPVFITDNQPSITIFSSLFLALSYGLKSHIVFLTILNKGKKVKVTKDKNS